jgi:DNA-directed RNA polymerase subunit K/omega
MRDAKNRSVLGVHPCTIGLFVLTSFSPAARPARGNRVARDGARWFPAGSEQHATVTDEIATTDQGSETETRKPVLSPLDSRFLFVDIAAARAKQLRRGAVPRVGRTPEGEPRPDAPRKAERLAMEEVRQGLISYDLPELKPPTGGPKS